MNNTYKLTHNVSFGEIDANYRMRFDGILSVFQIATLFHSIELNVGTNVLLENSNAFWVLSKAKFKILKTPTFSNKITVETWPLPVTPVRFNREYKITVADADCVLGTSEWVTLDATTKMLRKSQTIKYPFDLVHRTDVSGAGEYSRKREPLTDDNLVYTHTVRFVDIDPNNHTNNVAYVKMALNAFSIEEFNSANFTEFEIQFMLESYYGNKVSIYKVKTDYGYYVEGKTNEKTVFICILK